MTRKRHKVNWFLVLVLLTLIAMGVYVDRVVQAERDEVRWFDS